MISVTDRNADLTELELDALTELVNLGVSRAAVSLREMVGEQVLLSVPNVRLVSRDQAVSILGQREDSRLVAVHQIFEVVHEAVGRMPAQRVRPQQQDVAADPEHRDGSDG